MPSIKEEWLREIMAAFAEEIRKHRARTELFTVV